MILPLLERNPGIQDIGSLPPSFWVRGDLRLDQLERTHQARAQVIGRVEIADAYKRVLCDERHRQKQCRRNEGQKGARPRGSSPLAFPREGADMRSIFGQEAKYERTGTDAILSLIHI